MSKQDLLILPTPNDQDITWMFPDFFTEKPKYITSKNYKKECQQMSSLKGELEKILMDQVMVNTLLKDQYITQNKKLKMKIELHKQQVYLNNIDLKKKKRRKAIIKEFKCTSEGCEKDYCSIDALALHIKRKHPQDFNNFCLNRKKIKRDVLDRKDSQYEYSMSNYKMDTEVCHNYAFPKENQCDDGFCHSVGKSTKSTCLKSNSVCDSLLGEKYGLFDNYVVEKDDGVDNDCLSDADIFASLISVGNGGE